MCSLHSLVLTVLAVWNGWAQVPAAGTVENLVSTVRSALQARQPDEQIARTIEAILLTERLDDEAIKQLQMLEQAQAWALRYTENLPNFLCTRKVSRYTKHEDPAAWKNKDTLTWELGHAEGKDCQNWWPSMAGPRIERM